MTKKDLSEADICAKCITPAVVQAGWDEATQIRREVGFTRGRIIVRGKLVTRGKAKRADYVLYYQHMLIVLDREVGSMTEFKQIVGRGTRVHEDTRKYYFNLIDFRKATNHFADPEFDGEPV